MLRAYRKRGIFIFFVFCLFFFCQTVSFADAKPDNNLIVDSIITCLEEDFQYMLADTEGIAINYQTIETLESETQSRVFLYVQLEIFTPYGDGTRDSKLSISAPFEVYLLRGQNQDSRAVAGVLYDAAFDANQIWKPYSDPESHIRTALSRHLSPAQYKTAVRFLEANQEVPRRALEFIAAMRIEDKQALKEALQNSVQKRISVKAGKERFTDTAELQTVQWTILQVAS